MSMKDMLVPVRCERLFDGALKEKEGYADEQY